jgi:hypothetical protein
VQAFGAALALALLIALAICCVMHGASGPVVFLKYLRRGFEDFLHMSAQRVMSIAILTYTECLRMRAMYVFAIFAVLYMFAGWFLRSSNDRVDLQIPEYVVFVLASITWMVLLVTGILSCWGLPNDIRLRSIHTVVTKPVRRNEIVIGRLLGYTAMGTLILVVMGAIGYIWIVRQVPPNYQNQLISRVPVYGLISFTDRFGNDSKTGGINVGDIWEFRSFIEGATKARTFYDFHNLDVATMKNDYEARQKKATAGRTVPAMTLEHNFEAFRSFKGTIDQRLYCQVSLVNLKDPKIRATLKPFQVMEFSKKAGDKLILIPEQIEFLDDVSNESRTLSLFKDIITDNQVRVEVACVDPNQYLGMAREDLFVRTPDRTFLSSYSKSIFGIWMQMFMIILIGVTSTCFVKGPVATLLTGGFFFVGQIFQDLLQKLTRTDHVYGGGSLEAAYRMFNHMNMQSPLETNPLTNTIKFIDANVLKPFLTVSQFIVPDFAIFNMAEYTKNGFDVPWNNSLLPGLCTMLAYVIPCILIGYYSLQLREMEAK